jgi:hypothetical protein
VRRCTFDGVECARDTSYGMRGCIYMMQPSRAHFDLLVTTLRKQGEYGDARLHIGPDEKLLTDLYLDEWTHVHTRYGCNSWRSCCRISSMI